MKYVLRTVQAKNSKRKKRPSQKWVLNSIATFTTTQHYGMYTSKITLRIFHYVVKVTKNRVRPCSAVILPLTWGCTLLDCKSKKFSSNMVRSGLKIRPKYEAYFIRQPIEGLSLEHCLLHKNCSQQCIKEKKISSNMVRSGLKIRSKYEAYFASGPVQSQKIQS